MHDLAHLLHRQHLDRLNGMDHLMMVHLFRCVVEIVNQNLTHQQGVVKMDVLQIRDEQNLDEVLTFLDAVRHFLANFADVQVDEELRHLLNPLRMDYFLDEVLASVLLQLVCSQSKPVVLVQMLRLLPLHEMPSRHQDLHRARLPTLQRVPDQPLHSSSLHSFSRLPS